MSQDFIIPSQPRWVNSDQVYLSPIGPLIRPMVFDKTYEVIQLTDKPYPRIMKSKNCTVFQTPEGPHWMKEFYEDSPESL